MSRSFADLGVPSSLLDVLGGIDITIPTPIQEATLPDAIDLLTISVESGLAFDAAVQQVAKNTDGPKNAS